MSIIPIGHSDLGRVRLLTMEEEEMGGGVRDTPAKHEVRQDEEAEPELCSDGTIMGPEPLPGSKFMESLFHFSPHGK